VIRWGQRVTPLGTTDIDLPPCTKTAVEIVKEFIARKSGSGPTLQKIELPCE
jgi:3-oxoacyl-[acyl-carrier-protein] synthase-3